MRTLIWIFGTLLRRSWLIVIGIALGLLARQYIPQSTSLGQPQIVDPYAKAYYDSVSETVLSSRSSEPAILPPK